jgi:hypothetical protein
MVMLKGDTMSERVELTISCSCCVRRGTPDCDDCLVSFVVGHDGAEVQLESDDLRAAQMLVDEGMISPLRYLTVVRR